MYIIRISLSFVLTISCSLLFGQTQYFIPKAVAYNFKKNDWEPLKMNRYNRTIFFDFEGEKFNWGNESFKMKNLSRNGNKYTWKSKNNKKEWVEYQVDLNPDEPVFIVGKKDKNGKPFFTHHHFIYSTRVGKLYWKRKITEGELAEGQSRYYVQANVVGVKTPNQAASRPAFFIIYDDKSRQLMKIYCPSINGESERKYSQQWGKITLHTPSGKLELTCGMDEFGQLIFLQKYYEAFKNAIKENGNYRLTYYLPNDKTHHAISFII